MTSASLKPDDIVKLNNQAHETLRYIQIGLSGPRFEDAAENIFDLYAITHQYRRDFKTADAHLQATESTGAIQNIKQVVDGCSRALKWIHDELRECRAMARELGVFVTSDRSLGHDDATREKRLREHVADIQMWVESFGASLKRLGKQPLKKHPSINHANFRKLALVVLSAPAMRTTTQAAIESQWESIIGLFRMHGASRLEVTHCKSLIIDFLQRLPGGNITTPSPPPPSPPKTPKSRRPPPRRGYDPTGDDDDMSVKTTFNAYPTPAQDRTQLKRRRFAPYSRSNETPPREHNLGNQYCGSVRIDDPLRGNNSRDRAPSDSFSPTHRRVNPDGGIRIKREESESEYYDIFENLTRQRVVHKNSERGKRRRV